MMRRSHLVLCFCLGGCAAGAGDRSLPPRSTWAHALVSGDCAPWDGAATTVTLSNQPADTAAEPRPSLRLTIFQGTGSVGGARWPLGESKPGGGMGWWCPPAGDCAAVSQGWVELAAWPGTGPLSGRYRITLPDGHPLAGSFTAEFDPRRVLCG